MYEMWKESEEILVWLYILVFHLIYNNILQIKYIYKGALP